MKKIIQMGLKFSCGAIGAMLLSITAMSANSISMFSLYEYKMPAKLLPKDEN